MKRQASNFVINTLQLGTTQHQLKACESFRKQVNFCINFTEVLCISPACLSTNFQQFNPLFNIF